MAFKEEILIGSKADTRGFKKADTAAAKLNKTLKNLAGTIGIAYGTTAIANFGKEAVKAFAADEAAALRLSKAVDNLGISFANPAIAKFISELESSAGIADDVLRPAFQGLLTTTGSLTQSQKLLNDAITVSRASGIDLATVSQDLANGYVGITRGLKKYNTGLTQAELASKSFSEILGILLEQSSGAANAYLSTTSFKFDVLTLAVDNAKEAIGKGLVDALARAGGGTEAKDAVKAIDAIAKAINGVTLATGTAVGGVTGIFSTLKNLPKNIFQGFVGKQGGINSIPKPTPKAVVPTKTAQEKALAKLESDAAKRAKALAAAQLKATKALTAEQKKQAALKKAGTVFDLEQIGLVAALKGKLSKDEELRVKAQLALLNDNDALATKLTNEILKAQDESGNLAKFLSSLPNAKNPFEYLDGYLSYLAGKAAAIITNQPVPSAPSGGNTTVPTIPSTNVPTMPSDNMITYNPLTGLNYNPNANNVVKVELTLNANDDVSRAIANNLQQSSLSSGNQTYINRRTGGFE
jgi:hypothetical protein